MTYIIKKAEDIKLFRVGLTITDALSGREYAVSQDGKRKVALNVPLADCCDEPVELCACLAPVVRVANNQVAA